MGIAFVKTLHCVQIRFAVSSDCQAIAELHVASWRHAYRGALSDEFLAGDIVSDRNALWESRFSRPQPNQCVIVAEDDNQLAGFACAYVDDDAQWGSLLDNIHVKQSNHRAGVGTALLRAVTAHCAAVSPQSGLYLWVLQSNVVAQKFYLRHGASNVGVDIWSAPGGTKVPRYRFAWPAIRLRR